MIPPIEIAPGQLHEKLARGEAVHLVDCREPDEQAVVALAGATLIPMRQTPARVAEVVALGDGPLVVYCHHGMRSLRVAQWLRENGAPHAQSLAGGIDAWAVEVDPTLPRY